MSQMLRRPPAKLVHLAPQQGPLGQRVRSVGSVDQAKSYGAPEAGRANGRLDFRAGAREIRYVWQHFTQVNPAHEQPKLIYSSGAQPFTVGMQLRRFSRTFMAASPRFFGRWAYVGMLQRQYTERARMTGVATRQGTTYAYQRPATAPRTVQLGGGAASERRAVR